MTPPVTIHTDSLEELLRYSFSDPKLLIQAVTHPSYRHETDAGSVEDYQRLEFLGDAVLGLLLAEMLYIRYPLQTEGHLSRCRSALADQATLADISRDLGIGDFIRLGRGETISLGMTKDSILSDVLEAVIGAVYCDGGLEAARQLVARIFSCRFDQIASQSSISDSKSEFQERMSLMGLSQPVYSLIEESGPPHERVFRYLVSAGDVTGEGEGRSKKIAQQAAALQALRRLSPDSS